MLLVGFIIRSSYGYTSSTVILFSSLTLCLPGTLFTYFLNDFEMVSLAFFITGICQHSTHFTTSMCLDAADFNNCLVLQLL